MKFNYLNKDSLLSGFILLLLMPLIIMGMKPIRGLQTMKSKYKSEIVFPYIPIQNALLKSHYKKQDKFQGNDSKL